MSTPMPLRLFNSLNRFQCVGSRCPSPKLGSAGLRARERELVVCPKGPAGSGGESAEDLGAGPRAAGQGDRSGLRRAMRGV